MEVQQGLEVRLKWRFHMQRSRDRDSVRDAIYQRWNSNMESVGKRISSVMELEASGSRVDIVL